MGSNGMPAASKISVVRPWMQLGFSLVGADDELGEELVRQRVKVLTIELAVAPGAQVRFYKG